MKNKTTPTRDVAYTRASTGEQVDSCDQQVRACRDRAEQLGLEVSQVYEDNGITGSRHDRPGYLRMLEAAEHKQFDTLLLWKQSRLGRDSVEVERAMRRLESHGVRVITCDGYDTAGASLKNRKLARGVKGLIDEAYLDDLREDTRRGLQSQFDKGYWTGGRVYGYGLVEVTSESERDPYGRPKRVGSHLEKDTQQANIVVEIFERYADGQSEQTIAGDLNARGVPSPGSTWNRTVRRAKGWARSGIRVLLRNPIYAGTYYYNRRECGKSETGRRTAKLRPADEVLGTPGNAAHLAIIDAMTWARVLTRVNANAGKARNERSKSGGKAVYMLSGMLKCQCGAHFVMDSATHYRCGKALDGKGCEASNALRVRRDVAERVILGPIVEELLSPAMVEEMAAEMRRYYASEVAKAQLGEATRPTEVLELDARIARLRERLRAGDPDMAPDELLAVIERAEQKRLDLLMARPKTAANDDAVRGLPSAAKMYREQIGKGLQGNRDEASQARHAVRRLLGEKVLLVPSEDCTHLVAHVAFQRAALLAGNAGTVGSGGRI